MKLFIVVRDRVNDKRIMMINVKVKKEPRKNKADFGPNFIAPDGGYAWIICVCVGLTNVSGF